MLDPRAGEVDPSALAARLKLATESLLRGDDEGFQRQMDQLDEELPLARLAMRISTEVGPSLQSIPDGVAARLARISTSPGPRDLLLPYREDLTELARYSWELQDALRRDDPERVDILQAYCSALAALIVEDLEDRPQPLPNLDPHATGNDETPGRMK